MSSEYSVHDELKSAEEATLLANDYDSKTTTRRDPKCAPFYLSVGLNALLLGAVVILSFKIEALCPMDLSLGIWSPANEIIEYIKEQPFRAALFNKTEFMGYPTDEVDILWSDLYNFDISKISEEEASKLPMPTLAIPGTNDYLVQLDVWHQLHCLNDMRKILYPERFPGLKEMTVDGVIDRSNPMFMHWEHCIDSLRQVLMSHADVSPISFHINEPVRSGIFPRLATTHTCRNFSKVQDWARRHSAGAWNYNLTAEQADEIVEAAAFDQSPLEDIEFLWTSFPNNLFFKHCGEEAGLT